MFVHCLLDRGLHSRFVVGMLIRGEQNQQGEFEYEIREQHHCQLGPQVDAVRVSFDLELD